MKPNYKNWVPKGMIYGIGAGLAVTLLATVLGILYRGMGIFNPLNTGWVDAHVAFVLSVAFACYKVDGNLKNSNGIPINGTD